LFPEDDIVVFYIGKFSSGTKQVKNEEEMKHCILMMRKLIEGD